jgi:hypothetical protein
MSLDSRRKQVGNQKKRRYIINHNNYSSVAGIRFLILQFLMLGALTFIYLLIPVSLILLDY